MAAVASLFPAVRVSRRAREALEAAASAAGVGLGTYIVAAVLDRLERDGHYQATPETNPAAFRRPRARRRPPC